MIEVEVFRVDANGSRHSTGNLSMLLDTGADISCLPSEMERPISRICRK